MTALQAHSPDDERAGDILRLRREIGRMQRRHSDEQVLPLPSALASILPGGGLQRGVVYTVSPSLSLLFALMSAASQGGSWCAAVGMPDLGAEAASAAGIDLGRLVLVPEPGDRWMTVLAALAEVVPLIAVYPGSAVRDAEASRLGARLRDRGCTVLAVAGPAAPAWPQSEGLIGIRDPRWEGLGTGWGLLSERTVTVTAQTRATPRPQGVRVRLPGRHGAVEQAPPAPIARLGRSEPSRAASWAVAG